MLKNTVFFILTFLLVNDCVYSQSLSLVWATDTIFKNPETALYNAKWKSIFVSNINGNMYEKDGNGFISKISLDGKIENLKWVEGLNGPKGMEIFKDTIFVTDIDELVLISIKEAKIIRKIKVEGAVFLNDVAITKNGKVFISDTKAAKIFCYADGKVSLWLESDKLQKINGMLAEKTKLIVCNQKIMEVDLKTKEIKTLVETTGGVDGIERLGKNEFLYSNWDGRVYITKNSRLIKLLDTTKTKQQSGDLDYIPSKKLVIIPTLGGNSITCYKLKIN
ncbi:MAG: ATP-binding protein [Bacteroidota bacterium]